MKTSALIIMILTSAILSQCKTDEITQVIFKTSTRGYSKSITITKDSVRVVEQSRTKPETNRDVKRKISVKEWNNLVNTLKEYKLDELINLPSPTSDRATDKQTASNITITANGKTYDSGGFDGYTPNEKLSEFVKEIQKN